MSAAQQIAQEHAVMLRLLQRLRSLRWEACEGWPDDAAKALKRIETSDRRRAKTKDTSPMSAGETAGVRPVEAVLKRWGSGFVTLVREAAEAPGWLQLVSINQARRHTVRLRLDETEAEALRQFLNARHEEAPPATPTPGGKP